MSKTTCDLCEEDAVQQYITEGGEGPTISRCAAHSVPEYDVPRTWVTPEALAEIQNPKK